MSVLGKLLKRASLLKAQDGDVLVIRYGGRATARDAHRFADDLNKAIWRTRTTRSRPSDSVPTLPVIPIVFAPKGVEWSLERKP